MKSTESHPISRGLAGCRSGLVGTAALACLFSFTTVVAQNTASPGGASNQAADEKVVELDPFQVVDRVPFTDANVDIVRTVDDVQPYYLLDDSAIEEVGAVNVEDFLKQRLTMNTTAHTNGMGAPNFLGNTSSVNLRGLGAGQTLMLVNGRRTAGPNFFGATNQADVNGIPAAAISRIEVLPASSSAIYGGAALGGVVNIVLKNDFEGVQLKGTYEDTTSGHAPIKTADAVAGFSLEGGKTKLVFMASWSDIDALLNKDRPELLERGTRLVTTNNPSLVSSPTLPFGFGTTPNIGNPTGANLTLDDGTSLGSPIAYIPTGFTASSAPSGLLATAGSHNFNLGDTTQAHNGLSAQLTSAPEQKFFGISLRRHMTDAIDAFVDFTYSSNSAFSTYNQLSDFYTVPASAPTNPFQQTVRVSIPDPGSYPYNTASVSRRIVVGAVATLPHDWKAEIDYTWNASYAGYDSRIVYDNTSIGTALANGTLNPFVDTLATPLNFDPYRGYFGFNGRSTLDNVAIRAAGPVWSLPAGDATLASGLEYRHEAIDDGRFFRVSPSFPTSSFNLYRAYLPQSQDTYSGYVETNIPVLGPENKIAFARRLDVQAAMRTERYSVGTGTGFMVTGPDYQYDPDAVVSNTAHYTSTNTTVGARYMPVKDLMLRASRATAFLPPSYSQIFSEGQDPAPITVIDPKRGFATVSVNRIRGGNPDLEPQEAESINFGFVYEPSAPALKGLRFGIDWYRIEQSNVILTPTVQQIVDNESQFPDRVVRGPLESGSPYAVGPITLVNYTLINANESLTEGVDYTVSYERASDTAGTWAISGQATAIDSYKVQNTLNAPLTELVGQVSNGGPVDFRANVTVSWSKGPWSAAWTALYYADYPQYAVGTNAYLLAQGSNSIPSQTYHNVVVGYRFPRSASGEGLAKIVAGLDLQVGIKNVFDKVPPFDAFRRFDRYYSPFGSARLRTWWISASKQF